jgi:hypothetical protein
MRASSGKRLIDRFAPKVTVFWDETLGVRQIGTSVSKNPTISSFRVKMALMNHLPPS